MVEQEIDEPQAEVLISAAEDEQQRVANMQNFNRFKRIANTVTTEPAMFLFMCSALIKFPVFQELLYEKSCLQIFSQNISFCDDIKAVHKNIDLQHSANHLLLASSICLLLPSMITALLLGSMLDVWNAKRSILIPFVGLLFADVNYVLQCAFLNWNPYLLLISDLLFGLSGGFTAIIGLLFAYSVKMTSTQYRSERVAVMEGAIGFGSMFGFFLSGQLRQIIGFLWIFVLITVLHLITIAYILAFIKDCPISKANQHKQTQTTNEQTDYGALEREGTINENNTPNNSGLKLFRSHFKAIYDCYTTPREQWITHSLRILLIALTIELICFSGLMDIMFSYLRFKLVWTDKEYGWYNGASSGLASFLVIFLYPVLHKRFNWSDHVLAIMGLLGKIVNLVVLSFTTSTVIAMLTIFPLMFSRFIATGMRALASSFVEQQEQGKIFSLISLLEGLAFLLASLIFNGIYPLTLRYFSGTVLLITAALLLLPVGMLIHIKLIKNRADTTLE